MKFVIALSAFALTTGAFATEFSAKIGEVDCKIANGVVTRTMTFGKENKAVVTETKTVKFEGLAPFVEKAVETASTTPVADPQFTYTLKHEGKTYFLSANDSRETLTLMGIITKTCR